MRKFILKDQLVDEEQAFVHVTDLALLRGYGVFDFFRLVGAKPLFLDDHLQRFLRSASHLRLNGEWTFDKLKKLVLDMIRANKMADSGVRLVMTGGSSPNGYQIGEPFLIGINEPINPLPPGHFADGIKLITTEYQRDLPSAKTINYIRGIHTVPEIQEKNAVDVLYVFNGHVLEVTRSNFFIITRDNVIKTAGTGILEGINRQHILKMAASAFRAETGTVTLEELKTAREAFITGTTKKITPVVQIDQTTIGNGQPGPVTRQLMSMYEDYVDGWLKHYKDLF